MIDPLTPPECDLRGLSFMPLDIRLFGSEFHAQATDGEWRAGVTLFLRAWHQTPAASLPKDEISLARLAEFGRDVKGWRKVAKGALHGWVEATDGRLYHPVLAGEALKAWGKRLQYRERALAGSNKRWGAKSNTTSNATSIDQAMPDECLDDAKGRDKTGKGQDILPNGSKRASALPADYVPSDGSGKMSEIAATWSAQKRQTELERWRAHHLAKGSKMVNWDMAWQTWIGNSQKFGGNPRIGYQNQEGHSGIPL